MIRRGLPARIAYLAGIIPSLVEPFHGDPAETVQPTYAWLAAQTGQPHRLVMVACRTLLKHGIIDLADGELVTLTAEGRRILDEGRAALTRPERRRLARAQAKAAGR